MIVTFPLLPTKIIYKINGINFSLRSYFFVFTKAFFFLSFISIPDETRTCRHALFFFRPGNLWFSCIRYDPFGGGVVNFHFAYQAGGCEVISRDLPPPNFFGLSMALVAEQYYNNDAMKLPPSFASLPWLWQKYDAVADKLRNVVKTFTLANKKPQFEWHFHKIQKYMRWRVLTYSERSKEYGNQKRILKKFISSFMFLETLVPRSLWTYSGE